MTLQDEYGEIIALLENIEEGSRLFFTRTFSSFREECYPFMHAPTYAIIKKSAFVPSLFAFGTQQPVRFNEEPVSVIKSAPSRPVCPGYPEPIYQEVNWDTIIKQYDYILVGREDDYKDIPTSLMYNISTGKNYALYKTKELGKIKEQES